MSSENAGDAKPGSPLLGEYILWLRDAGGSCQTGYYPRNGKFLKTITLIGPDGDELPLSMKENQTMSSSMVAHCDRVLKVASPFPKLHDRPQ